MNETEIIKKLTEMGGKLWEKGTMRRVYFNAQAWGLEVNHYNTGNISSATINGQGISNAEGYRCQNVKIWYDLSDGKFHTKDADRIHSVAQEAIDNFIATAL